MLLLHRYSPLRTPFFCVGGTRCSWQFCLGISTGVLTPLQHGIPFYCGWGARNRKGNVVEGKAGQIQQKESEANEIDHADGVCDGAHVRMRERG